MVGPNVSIPDRVAGALLGAVRVGLLAVLLVLVFDRIIPPGREPAFLQGSQWRPVLSQAGQQGLRSLPPDVVGLHRSLEARARDLRADGRRGPALWPVQPDSIRIRYWLERSANAEMVPHVRSHL